MEIHNVKIIDATVNFYDDIKQLCDESFGTGYLDRAEYDRWILQPHLFNIALVDDKFAGYSAMLPVSIEDIIEYMGMKEAEVQAITGNKPALIYKSVAVQPKYRKNGILTKLIKGLLNNAKELGYGSVIVSAWTYGGKTPAENSLISMDFTRLYHRHMLWYRNENYRCVICNGRCICDALIFYKIL